GERAMKRDLWLPWLVFGVTVVGLLVAGTLLVQRIAHLRRAPTSQAPGWSPARTRVTDYASGGMLTIAFRSGNDFPGGSFEDRGQRLVVRRFDPPTARLQALG